MIYAQDLEKIKLIDKALNAMPIDDVMEMFSDYIVIDKLKGTENRSGPVFQAIEQVQRLETEVMMAKSECQMLKSDIQVLIRCLSKGLGDHTVVGDFNNLKQRHGVY